mmetsp:Transcript_11621/g.38851  ORF Transcript_11621/g.38851 Transcript_11621/m.38851 type:complete len:204 (-) Transcript_11621:45-656(-)
MPSSSSNRCTRPRWRSGCRTKTVGWKVCEGSTWKRAPRLSKRTSLPKSTGAWLPPWRRRPTTSSSGRGWTPKRSTKNGWSELSKTRTPPLKALSHETSVSRSQRCARTCRPSSRRRWSRRRTTRASLRATRTLYRRKPPRTTFKLYTKRSRGTPRLWRPSLQGTKRPLPRRRIGCNLSRLKTKTATGAPPLRSPRQRRSTPRL